MAYDNGVWFSSRPVFVSSLPKVFILTCPPRGDYKIIFVDTLLQ